VFLKDIFEIKKKAVILESHLFAFAVAFLELLGTRLALYDRVNGFQM
jgi:hypothetical protein